MDGEGDKWRGRGGHESESRFVGGLVLVTLSLAAALCLQVQVGDSRLFAQAGSVGFLLWRSVYLTKQVSVRTRVLVLFDWLKTQLFGRDVTRL